MLLASPYCFRDTPATSKDTLVKRIVVFLLFVSACACVRMCVTLRGGVGGAVQMAYSVGGAQTRIGQTLE